MIDKQAANTKNSIVPPSNLNTLTAESTKNCEVQLD